MLTHRGAAVAQEERLSGNRKVAGSIPEPGVPDQTPPNPNCS